MLLRSFFSYDMIRLYFNGLNAQDPSEGKPADWKLQLYVVEWW